MADLGVSVLVLAVIVAVCEVARRVCARLLPGLGYGGGGGYGYGACAAELISTLQLCACTHELKLLADAGVSRPTLVALALTYCAAAVQAVTSRGATCNPTGALERFLLSSRSSPGAARLTELTARVSCQFAAAVVARSAARLVWSRGLSELHERHRAADYACANPIRPAATTLEAAAVEMACALAVHAAGSCTRGLRESVRVHAGAAVITAVVYAGGSTTGAVFNPALAFSTQFSCTGATFTQYSLVYWLGPLAGMLLSVLLFDKIIPALLSSHRDQKLDTSDQKKKKRKKK